MAKKRRRKRWIWALCLVTLAAAGLAGALCASVEECAGLQVQNVALQQEMAKALENAGEQERLASSRLQQALQSEGLARERDALLEQYEQAREEARIALEEADRLESLSQAYAQRAEGLSEANAECMREKQRLQERIALAEEEQERLSEEFTALQEQWAGQSSLLWETRAALEQERQRADDAEGRAKSTRMELEAAYDRLTQAEEELAGACVLLQESEKGRAQAEEQIAFARREEEAARQAVEMRDALIRRLQEEQGLPEDGGALEEPIVVDRSEGSLSRAPVLRSPQEDFLN